MSVKNFLKSLLPINFADKAAQVPSMVQRDIDRILNDAHKAVADLKAKHSVAAAEKDLADDLAAFEAFAAKHRALLVAHAEKRCVEAKAVLPPLALPPDPLPGAM